MSNTHPEPGRAMEYVLGTLPADERQAFEQELLYSDALQEEVRYWEQALQPLNNSVTERAPADDSWDAIAARIAPADVGEARARDSWLSGWRWLLPAMTLSLLLGLLLGYGLLRPPAPTADYVAVLTNDAEQPLLTALTTVENQSLQLQWGEVTVAPDTSLQLWAISKRDGQVRSIAIFDQAGATRLPLDEAATRLIKDARSLLLTEEESGGSAIDEPSDVLLAKGVCVRLSGPADTI